MNSFLHAVETQRLDLHAVAVFHRGRIAGARWWAPYRPEARHVAYSMTKTFTALGVLFAVQEEVLSLEDPVLGFFPRSARRDAGLWKDLRVRHLLTMSLGMDGDPTPEVVVQRDWVKALFSRPLDHAPGSKFVYNNMASYLASAVVQAAAGVPLKDWLVPRLFEPLGIADPDWEQCPLGRTIGGWGLSLTLDEVIRLGRFLLGRGAWEGRQLLDPELFDEAVRKHIETGTDPDNDSHQGYGFQLWRCRRGGFRAEGAFGQLCVVRPDLDLVVAVQAGVPDAQPVLNLIWEHLVPGKDLDLAGPPLTHLPPPLGEAAADAETRFDTWKDRVWILQDHPRGWIQAGFRRKGSVPVFWYRDDRGVHEAPFGWGRWLESVSRLWRHDYQKRRRFLTVASGRWESDQSLVLTLRLPEQPPVVTLTFRRDGRALFLDQSLTVSIRPSNFSGIRGEPCEP